MFDIQKGIDLILYTINGFFTALNKCQFFIGSAVLRLGDVLVCMLILMIVVGFFWKGAKE